MNYKELLKKELEKRMSERPELIAFIREEWEKYGDYLQQAGVSWDDFLLAEATPIGRLSDELLCIGAYFDIVKDALERKESITLRDYATFNLTPQKLLGWLLRHNFEQIMSQLGYVRCTKFLWRRWDVENVPDYSKLEVVKEKLGISMEDAKVVCAGYLLLRQTYPFAKDWKGFNIIHAFKVKDIFLLPPEKFLSQIPRLAKILSKYPDQMLELERTHPELKGIMEELK